jgi:hypothetical protein
VLAREHLGRIALEQSHDRSRALAVMLGRYLQCADTGPPVHTWPVTGPTR